MIGIIIVVVLIAIFFGATIVNEKTKVNEEFIKDGVKEELSCHGHCPFEED
ncbi:MAG: hypothetical protein QM489_03805 [Candidatus Izemoplasma sp.]